MMLQRSMLSILLCLLADITHAGIILLLSNDRPPITHVANALRGLYSGKIEVFNLQDDLNRAASIASEIGDHNFAQVVAIGLLAAQVARHRLNNKQVIFCQVLNYQEFDLITPLMKGVSALPPSSPQLKKWKEVNPGLQRVGVITGVAMQPLIAEAQETAEKLGIELVHVVVKSDREAPLALARMNNVQGLWLVPDSTILSAQAISQIMISAIKLDIQVLGFSPILLSQGALLSGTADEADIATHVIDRLRQAEGQRTMPGPAIVRLSKAKMSINSTAAKKFGILLSNSTKETLIHVD